MLILGVSARTFKYTDVKTIMKMLKRGKEK